MVQFQSRNQKATTDKSQLALLMRLLQKQGKQAPAKPLQTPVNRVQLLLNQLNGMAGQTPTVASPDPAQMLMSQLTSLQNQVYEQKTQPQPMDIAGMANLVATASILNDGGNKSNIGSCIWVTRVPEGYQTPDFLFNIFGCYGNISRIKFSKKKPDGALVQFFEPHHAFKAVKCLDGVHLGGDRLSVKPCKIERCILSKDDGEENAKDFTKLFMNRYVSFNNKNAQAKKFAAICLKRARAPTSRIMVSNIPAGKIDLVKKYIIEYGYTVKDVEEGKAKETKSGTCYAFFELGSQEEAVGAVGKLHNTMPSKIGEKRVFGKGEKKLGLTFTFASKYDIKNSTAGAKA